MVSSSCNLAMNHTTLPASPGVNGWCTSLSSTPPPIAWGTSWKALPGEGLGCPLFVGGRLYTVHTHTYMGVGQNLFIINSNGMNIHLPAILMFTRGTRFWHTAIYIYIHVYYESWFYHILVLGSFYFQNGSNDNHRRAGIVVECGSPTATGSTGPLSLSAQNLAFATCLQSSWCPLILQFYWDLPKIFVLLQWELKNVCWSMRFATAPALLFSSGQLADRRRVQRKSKKRKPRTS